MAEDKPVTNEELIAALATQTATLTAAIQLAVTNLLASLWASKYFRPKQGSDYYDSIQK